MIEGILIGAVGLWVYQQYRKVKQKTKKIPGPVEKAVTTGQAVVKELAGHVEKAAATVQDRLQASQDAELVKQVYGLVKQLDVETREKVLAGQPESVQNQVKELISLTA